MTERQNRTIICSVLFLDLVGYSRRPVAEQLKLRDRFNLLLREALKGVAANDRIILDTGDGAAVTFLGDPEDALFMALTLRDFVAQSAAQHEQELGLRSGINLGPVKLVKDLNGRPNIIGDGINVAQRIMSFSEPGQVLISRSYYEVVSRLSDDYSQLFKDEGVRTDKHVREHQVYGVVGDRPIPDRPQDGPRSAPFSALGPASAILERLNDMAAPWVRSLYASPRVTTAFVAIGILALGGVVRAGRDTPSATLAGRDVAVAVAVQPAVLAVPAQAPLAAGIAEKPARAAIVPTEAGVAAGSTAGPLPTAPLAQAPAPRKVAAAKPAKTAKTAPTAPTAPETSAQQEDSQVAVSFAVFPWGDVYVDGRHLGVSPPIRNVRLAPGRHKIEFRNTTFPDHVQVVEIKPGESVTVRHKFDSGASQ